MYPKGQQWTVFNFAFKAMGSPCPIQFYASSPQQAESVYGWSLTNRTIGTTLFPLPEESLITQINQRAGSGVKTAIDSETVALLHYSDQCFTRK